MSEYIIRHDVADVREFDPEIPIDRVDVNPFYFVRDVQSGEWKWSHVNGQSFELSPEPPGLQVYFDGVSVIDERKILEYLQSVTNKKTKVIQFK